MAQTSKTSEFTFFGGAVVALTAATSAQAQDVAGFYGGLSAGTPDGDNFLDYGSEYNFDGAAVGAFIGYNTINGDWVYGGEIAYTPGIDVSDGGTSFYSGMGLSDVVDFKGRLGRVFGKTLAYGSIGYTVSGVNASGDTSSHANGLNFGIGVEHPIGNRAFIGAEIMRRSLDVDPGLYIFSDSVNVNSASVRFGMRF